MASRKRPKTRADQSIAKERTPRWSAAAFVLLAAGLLACALLVTPAAESAFDAPKRLAASVAILAAAVCVYGFGGERLTPWRSSGAARVGFWAFSAAMVFATVSALVSPHRALAWDSLRMLFICVIAVAVGASSALSGGRSARLLAVFTAGALINGLVATLEVLGVYRPFAVEWQAGRTGGGFAGNEGYVALLLAMSGAAAAAVALHSSGRRRQVWGALAVLSIVAILATINVTAVLAAVAGLFVALATRYRARNAVISAVILAALIGGAALTVPPLRHRLDVIREAVAEGDSDRIFSYRFGPWGAAAEMAMSRPLFGWGPGTYAAEFVSHRIESEKRWQRRMTDPWLAGSYTEAHSEYLQAAGELGVPAALAFLAAAGALVGGLAARARTAGSAEPAVLLVFLVTAAVAALTWFPLQRPVTSLAILLCAGRAWRICQMKEEDA